MLSEGAHFILSARYWQKGRRGITIALLTAHKASHDQINYANRFEAV
jgi:hypothetical protein